MLAGLLTLFLLAQAGVPLTGGFVAKLSVFNAAVNAGQYSLALIGMLAAVVGAFVYLRIVLAMFAPADDEVAPVGPRIVVDRSTGVALTIAAAAIVFLGIVPGIVLDFARDATQLLAQFHLVESGTRHALLQCAKPNHAGEREASPSQ